MAEVTCVAVGRRAVCSVCPAGVAAAVMDLKASREPQVNDLGGLPAPARPGLLFVEAALRLSRRLISITEHCHQWPWIGLAILFVYKHVAASPRLVLLPRAGG